MKKTWLLLACLFILGVSCSSDGNIPVKNVEIEDVSSIKEVVFDMSGMVNYKAVISEDTVAMGIDSREQVSKSMGHRKKDLQWIFNRLDEQETYPIQFQAVNDKAKDFDGNLVLEGTVVEQSDIPGVIDKIYITGDYTFISYLSIDLDKILKHVTNDTKVLRGNVKAKDGKLSFVYTVGESKIELEYDSNGRTNKETLTFRPEKGTIHPENEVINVTEYDTCDYYSSPFRSSFIVDNNTGNIYAIENMNLSVHNSIVYDKQLGPVGISHSGDSIVVDPIVCNPDIYIYGMFKDLYGQYYILNDSVDEQVGNFMYYTKPSSYVPVSDGKVLKITFRRPIETWDSNYGSEIHTECISSIELVGESFSLMDIEENYSVSINYSAKKGFDEMPALLREYNEKNGHGSQAFPDSGSWLTFTMLRDGYLYGNYFRKDDAMAFVKIDLSNCSIRMNYYFAENNEHYFSLGGNAALVISPSLNESGNPGVYVVYPFEPEEYRQRAFDIVINTLGKTSEIFNTNNPAFADIKSYNDFHRKFFHAYLVVNSDVLVFDTEQPDLTLQYPLDEVYDYDKGHNVFKYYVWKEGYSEETFKDLYYYDVYDREELAKHTILNSIKYNPNDFKGITNPFDLRFKEVGLNKTIEYMLGINESGEYIPVEYSSNTYLPTSIVMQPLNRK